MAKIGIEFIKVVRRSDGCAFVVGRDVLEAEPHIFKEVTTESVEPEKVAVVSVPQEAEVVEDSDEVVLPNTAEEYASELKKMGVKFHHKTGLKKLMELYHDNL